MLSLNNKHIVLGITGGIAAYKSAELCRLLRKAGARVRVVMTAGAQAFITPLTMQALSGERVHTDLLDPEAEAAMGHIQLARWADLVLVAPASANFLARLSHGEGADLLSTLSLATTAPTLLAPAMNHRMWQDQRTRDNLDQLRGLGFHLLMPDSGDQACGESGPGRLPEPASIVRHAASLFDTGLLAGRHVLITAGPTREAIDPVRYISNHSSGRMGYALARAALEAGARVTLVTGPVSLDPPEDATVIHVETALGMLTACQSHPCDIFIAVAAVADYRCADIAGHKIKKDDETLSLSLIRNPDILATIAATQPRPFCVGFAAETDNLAGNARSKLESKRLDLVFANHATETFGREDAQSIAIWKEGEQSLQPASKAQLARSMVSLISQRLDTHA